MRMIISEYIRKCTTDAKLSDPPAARFSHPASNSGNRRVGSYPKHDTTLLRKPYHYSHIHNHWIGVLGDPPRLMNREHRNTGQ